MSIYVALITHPLSPAQSWLLLLACWAAALLFARFVVEIIAWRSRSDLHARAERWVADRPVLRDAETSGDLDGWEATA